MSKENERYLIWRMNTSKGRCPAGTLPAERRKPFAVFLGTLLVRVARRTIPHDARPALQSTSQVQNFAVDVLQDDVFLKMPYVDPCQTK